MRWCEVNDTGITIALNYYWPSDKRTDVLKSPWVRVIILSMDGDHGQNKDRKAWDFIMLLRVGEQLNTYESFISGIFYIIFSGHGWPWVTETRESETADKGGLFVQFSSVQSLSHVWLFATPWTVAYQAPPSMGFSRQENWSGLPFPSPGDLPDPGIEPGSPAL